MITVEVITDQEVLTQLTISGHAFFAPYGTDIVCAGVSSIVFGGLNAVQHLTPNDSTLQVDQNQVILQAHSASASIILQVMLIQLQTVAESYPQYLSIERKTTI